MWLVVGVALAQHCPTPMLPKPLEEKPVPLARSHQARECQGQRTGNQAALEGVGSSEMSSEITINLG